MNDRNRATNTLKIAPVCKSVMVRASPAAAFDVFTAGLDRWWPKAHHLGASPLKQSVLEPFVGGRWYALCEDGTECVVGHVQVWQPGVRLVCSWEISALWRPDPRPAFTSEVEVRFLDEGGQTRVELEHRNFERMGDGGVSMHDSVERGWQGILEEFAKAV